jgi:broad specificity phosphatase PhoE
MTRLVLVRHGQAVGADGICLGQADAPLSPEGARAIEALVADPKGSVARRVNAAGRVFSSDLARAAESARLIAAVGGVTVSPDPRLREMDFGAWNGQPWSAIESSDAERFGAWMAGWTTEATPGGERLGDVVRRAAEWLGEVVVGRTKPGETVLVVSHAGWIRAAVAHLRRLPMTQLFDLPVDHARATVVDLAPEAVRVTANAPHLFRHGAS